MSKTKYLTAPVPSKKMPASMPTIMLNETAERYAFYSFDAVLALFLLHGLRDMSGNLANLTEETAMEYKHYFTSAAYFAPVIGSLISDLFWGKFKTIIIFSIVYCVGFLAIAFNQTYLGAIIGLGLIATGAGIIKPCLSSNVGDQFGQSNKHLIAKAYNIFYWAINVGAFFSLLISPWIYEKYGDKYVDEYGIQVAFAVPGIFMIIATIIYFLGRKKLVHIPPKGKVFLEDALSKEGILIILRLSFFIFIFVAVYWALFSQSSSKWVYQAEKMNLNFISWNLSPDTGLGALLSKIGLHQRNWEILPAQMQAVNCVLVLTTIPFFGFVVYPLINKFFNLTPLRKIGIGFFIALPSFAIPAMVEMWIEQGRQPTIWWQVLAYWFLTAGEVLISIPTLEFAYTQAPKSMKSFIASLNLLSISLGNLLISRVNNFIKNEDGSLKLEGPAYYWFWTILLFVTGILFCIVVQFYRGKTYIQDEAPPEPAAENSE
jgi:POT family proton-dependent oligopeptide transporter